MHLRPHLEVNLGRLAENYLLYKNEACLPAQAAAVVKNDAYGLGAEAVVRTLYEKCGCRIFFVAHGFEGHSIRKVAPDAAIYVLQGLGQEDFSFFQTDNLIPVLCSLQQVAFWQETRPNALKPALQVETGLNRLGLLPVEIQQLPPALRSEFGLVISHLACADERTHPQNKSQLERFREIKPLFPEARFSLAASDGFWLGESFHQDVVRIGAALYGLNPTRGLEKKNKPVAALTAPIIQRRSLLKGDCVGYGADFTAPRAMRAAVVSIGYGDGLLRCFARAGKVWFTAGEKPLAAPLIGRVSMDNIVCDVSAIPAEILDQSEFVSLTGDFYDWDALAADLGTIGYEALSLLTSNPRLIRHYSE